MGWPLAFREKLAAGVISPIFVIQSEESLDLFASAPITAGSLQTVYPWLSVDGLTFGQYGVQPIEWVPESGAWRFVVIAGDPSEGRRLTILRALGRGTVVRLRMGFPGDGWADFQTVAQGRVSKTEITPQGTVVFEVWDVVAALTARWAGGGDLKAEPQIFSKYRAPTTLAAGYTVGDTTLTIGAAEPAATRQTGATGVVKITPASGAAAFYLRYTGSASGPYRLTGVSASVTYGTTAVNAALGSVVEYVPLVFGTIPDFVCKVLTSTGSGSNGAYDVLPETWGYGLRDGLHVDVSDIQSSTNSALTSMTGGGEIEVVVDPDPDDGLAWLNGVLSPYGVFLTVRQGLITLRCCQDIRPQSAATARVQRYGIDPAQVAPDTLSVATPDWTNLTYGNVGVKDTSATSAAGSPVRSYPSAVLKVYDVSASLWAYGSDVRAATLARLKTWAWVLGEAITCDVVGLDVWDLCPGDVIRWSYPNAGGLYASTALGWSARLAMVVSVQPDPLRGTVALTLATLPDDAADRLEV